MVATMWTLALLGVLSVVDVTLGQGGDCTEKRTACIKHPSCSKGLSEYFLNCVHSAYGKDGEREFKCRKAIATLLYAPNATGEDFLTCNCSGNARCIKTQTRTSTFFASVEVALAGLELSNSGDLGCSMVYALCAADSNCLAKWQRMMKQCPAMLLGRICNRDCRKVVDDLYTLVVGKGFGICQCDHNANHDFTKFNCLRYRRHQGELCSKPLPPEVTTVAPSRSRDNDNVPLVDSNNDVSILGDGISNSTQSGKYDIVNDATNNQTMNSSNEEESTDKQNVESKSVISKSSTVVKQSLALIIGLSYVTNLFLGL